MRRSYIREKKYQCGDAYMTVGIYAVTDQEHRQQEAQGERPGPEGAEQVRQPAPQAAEGTGEL